MAIMDVGPGSATMNVVGRPRPAAGVAGDGGGGPRPPDRGPYPGDAGPARDVLSDGLAAGDEAVAESRLLLAEDLNILSWLMPGSRGFDDAVGAFRHQLLAHLELVQRRHPPLDVTA